MPHHAVGSVGGGRENAEPDFELKADYIEHPLRREHCPRRFVVLCVIGFLFFKLLRRNIQMKQMPVSKQNDRLNGDMTLRRYERGNAGVRLPGWNDIRVERRTAFNP